MNAANLKAVETEVAAPQRFGAWMQTFSGVAFWPLDPRADEIHLIDVAHALAHQCRYAGHVSKFYSVAEHCVLMAAAMPTPELARYALLHDATEAYLVDVPRPVKRFMPEYRVWEDRLWHCVAARFGLNPDVPAEVGLADNAVLLDEARALMMPHPLPWNVPGPALGVEIQCWEPARAKSQFLIMAQALGVE